MKIIPAILEQNFNEIKNKIVSIKNDTSLIHIDICDGIFVPIKTWPYTNTSNDLLSQVLFIREMNTFEVHLMVANPEEIIVNLIKNKSGIVRVFVHFEIGIEKILNILNNFSNKIEIGLVVNLETDLNKIVALVNKFNSIQLMGRGHLGEQGYGLNSIIFERIKKIKEIGFSKRIIIDGGVTLNNLKKLAQSGVGDFVVGSAVWKDNNFVMNLKQLVNFID